MKRLIFSLFSLLFLVLPLPVFAEEGWEIDRFQSNIAIQESGKVQVTETIHVNFFDLEKHGIYRDIPYIYEADGTKTYSEIEVASVQQDGSAMEYDESRTGGYISLKIGDPDKTISGQHTYTIQYTVAGVLRGFTDYDELYWNVTGDNWPVRIKRAEAVVTTPRDGINKITCFEGYAGSQAVCQTEIEDPKTATFFALAPLGEAQGLTVVVAYEKGMVPLLTVERPKEFWEKFIEWPSLATLFVVLFSGFMTVLYLWNRHGRDHWFAQNIFGKKDDQGVKKPIGGHEPVTVEFTSPEKLRPAELGVLMDEQAHTHDVVATIIDLATRGYLTITEIPKKWVFGKVDYTLSKKQKDQAGLLGYEKTLLHSLFKSGNEIEMSSLKQTFYDELAEVKKEIYKEVVKKGLFPTDPEHVRSNYVAAAIVLIVIGGVGIGMSIAADLVYGADLALAAVAIGILLLIMAKFMPRRTAYGRELYRRARGYQLFIKTAEKHRQVFFEKKNMFNEVLPYAIMFGVTEKFAQQMKDMGIQPSTGWYSGVHPMHVGVFGSSMNDFSNSMSSAIASTPSSSGGFSGGSSGGGFGGGGGGSW
jgi:uncharacterized protein (TIGR04222 family)